MRIDNLYGTIKLARNNIIGADQLITVIFNEQVNGVVRVEGNEKINFIRVMQYLITFKRRPVSRRITCIQYSCWYCHSQLEFLSPLTLYVVKYAASCFCIRRNSNQSLFVSSVESYFSCAHCHSHDGDAKSVQAASTYVIWQNQPQNYLGKKLQNENVAIFHTKQPNKNPQTQ